MKSPTSEPIRLNKYLANLGIASRRKVEEMMTRGSILVNGVPATEQGIKVNPEKDVITIDGKKVSSKPTLLYILVNKPKGIISTVSDTHNRPTVTSLVPFKERLYPVGRLDQDSEGLILLTNDGDLTHKLTHPKFHIPKTYEVTILGNIKEGKVQQMSQGVEIEDGLTSPADVTVLRKEETQSLLHITLYEGKKRQIRRMCAALHLYLLNLKRIKFGPLALGDLPTGKWRELTEKELQLLFKSIGKTV